MRGSFVWATVPQLAASFISDQVCDVAYRHLADIPVAPFDCLERFDFGQSVLVTSVHDFLHSPLVDNGGSDDDAQ